MLYGSVCRGHAGHMDVRLVDASGTDQHHGDDLHALLARDDGFVWIDVPQLDDEARDLLSGLGCHPRVLEDCARRNHVPTGHSYRDHYFVVTHAPLEGVDGHVHMLELDQV